MKLLSTLTALLIAASTQAEVLVYKQNYTVTETGLGQVNKFRYRGYFIARFSAPLLKGRVSTMVDVGTPTGLFNWMDIPKAMTLSGFSKWGTWPQAVLCEYKGSFTLDIKTTKAQNRAGNDADATLAALKSILGAKGYVLVENWND